MQSLNFLILAAGMLAFAVLMNGAIEPGPGRLAGPALLAVCASGLVLAAVFPWEPMGVGFTVPRGHLAGAAFTFSGARGGLSLLSRRMTADPNWRNLARYTTICGAGILVLFVVTLTGARSEASPLRDWLGLLQRLMLLLWFPCIIILSWRALRLMYGAPAVEGSSGQG